MARNGSGTMVRAAATAIVTGTTITKAWGDAMATDYVDALTASIANDGQTPVLADLPMSGFKHTGVDDADALDQYPSVKQVQNGAFIWCGTAGGTANAITLTPSPAITAYAAGQTFRFKAGASSSTSAVTIAISSLSTIAVQNTGLALVVGEIQANQWYEITLDSASTCQIERIYSPGGTITTGSAPALTFGGAGVGITYSSTPTFNYTRIGRMILFNLTVALSNKGSSTGTASVSLPFTLSEPSMCAVQANNITLGGYVIANMSGTAMLLVDVTTGGGGTSLTNAEFTNSSTIFASGFFFV